MEKINNRVASYNHFVYDFKVKKEHHDPLADELSLLAKVLKGEDVMANSNPPQLASGSHNGPALRQVRKSAMTNAEAGVQDKRETPPTCERTASGKGNRRD